MGGPTAAAPEPPSLTRAAIAAIWQAHALGPVRQLVRTASGSRNESWLVNEAYVLRVNVHDPQFAKFRTERRAYDLLTPSGLPVPRVVALGESRRVIPYDYLIVTRLPGANLAESWRSLDPAHLSALVWEAGRMLARFHAHTLVGFGPLHRLEAQPFPTWPDYFHDYTERYLTRGAARGLFDTDLLARLRAARERAMPLLAGITQGVLVHSDYHYENLLQHDRVLSGVLDCEWALSGDPACDFATASVRQEMIPGSEARFVAGYTSLRALDATHARRVALYRLFLAVETAATRASHADRDGVQVALARWERDDGALPAS